MEKQEEIESLYFTEKKSLTEIAEILNMSVNCVSKRLRKNPNYTNEKEKRKNANLKKRRKTQKQMIYNARDSLDMEYQALKVQLENDIKLMSTGRRLSNIALRKWCSAYSWNNKKQAYIFDPTIKKCNDLPNIIRV